MEAFTGSKAQRDALLKPIHGFMAFWITPGLRIDKTICWGWAAYSAFVHNVQGDLRERSPPKIPTQPTEGQQGCVVNFKLRTSPLAGLNVGRSFTYNMPPRHLLIKAVQQNWSLGQLIVADDSGLEASHLCGTRDCNQPDHIDGETSVQNNSRKDCHALCRAGMTEAEIVALEEQCPHGKPGLWAMLKPCNIRARVAAANYAAYVNALRMGISARLGRVKGVNRL